MSALLAAVRADAPAGDVTADPRFEALCDMAENPHLRDWGRTLAAAVGLLTEHGPDLRVLDEAALAAFRVHGWRGLAEGLEAWCVALDTGWERVRPADVRRRAVPVRRLIAALARWLVDAPRAGGNAGLPPDDAEALRSCADLVSRFRELVARRFGEAVPVPSELVDALRSRAAQAVPAPWVGRSDPVPSAGAPASSDGGTAPVPPTLARTPSPGRPSPAPAVPEPPADDLPATRLPEALARLRQAVWPWADALRARDPSRPEGWRLARDVAFAAVVVPASGRVPTPVLPDPVGLERLADDPPRLLDAAERAWRRHLLWLDPHRHVATALRRLGHALAAEAVEQAVRALVRREPGLPDVVYAADGPAPRPDGVVAVPEPVACADEATRAWLVGPPAPEPPEPPAARQLVVHDDVLDAFRARLSEGRTDQALATLTGALRTAFPRERVRLGLAAAEVLTGAGRAELALPLLLSADDVARAHDLDAWEPDLAADLLVALLRAARGGLDPARREEVRRRLLRLGDLRALLPHP